MTEIKDWFLAILEQYGIWGLIVVTFLDSFISPIPPEVLFIPLSLANPEKALWFALVTTVISVVGAIVGYVLGLKGGRPLLRRFFSSEKISKAETFIGRYGIAAVLIASFTPIPYKLITVTSGVLGLSLKSLLFWSTLGRGARFFLEALLIIALGEAAKGFLEGKSFALLTMIVALIGIAGYYLYLIVRKKITSSQP